MANKAGRAFKDAILVLETLEKEGKEARLVGGCVRDRLIGLEPKDFDIATSALPEEVAQIFNKKPWKVVPTGLEHGTVTIVGRMGPIEVTTLRKDIDTDGRHAKVAFGGGFKEDAARRDFTINAMSEDRHGTIYDYFLGKKDLEVGLLRFVGEPEKRITEDYLRIMRFFRFWARFLLNPDPKAIDAIRKYSSRIKTVSQERITSELLLILSAKKPGAAINSMIETGILGEVLGKYLSTSSVDINEDPFSASAIERPLFRLSLILIAMESDHEVQQFAMDLKLSKAQAKTLIAFKVLGKAPPEAAADTAAKMEFLDRAEMLVGEGRLIDGFFPGMKTLYSDAMSIWNELEKVELTKSKLRRSRLPINGKEVSEITGITGPNLGKLMKKLLKDYRNGIFESKDQAIQELACEEKRRS